MTKMKSERTTANYRSPEDLLPGLVALAKGGREKVCEGECLTSEELAAFIEYPASNPAFMAHLAGCEDCYQEWFTLSQDYHQLGQEKKGANIISLLARPSFLAGVGSALAVAASVVVFLAIPSGQVGKLVSPLKQESVRLLEDNDTVLLESPVVEEEASLLKEEQAVISRSGSGAVKAESPAHAKTNKEKRLEKSAFQAVPNKKKNFIADVAEEDQDMLMRGQARFSYKEFVEELVLLCDVDKPQSARIGTLLQKTREELRQTSNAENPRYKKFHRIEAVLAKFPDDPKLFCDAALKILQE